MKHRNFPLFIKNFMFVFMILCGSSNQNGTGFTYRYRRFPLKDYSICKDARLVFDMDRNFETNTLTLKFDLIDRKFNYCFTHYILFLKSKHKIIQEKEISYVEEKQHIFENVGCGLYTVAVRPCYTNLQCSDLRIYADINMTNGDCYPSKTSLRQSYINISTETIIILSVVSIIVLIGFIKCIYFLAARGKVENTERIIYGLVPLPEPPRDRISHKNIHVFIFHHYNRILKEEVNNVLRDFIMQHFNEFVLSVRGIEDELPFFHIELNHWFKKVLREKNPDGSLNKIILINSNKDYEEDGFELENEIFSEIIKRLSDDTSRCLTGYNNLFVVQLGEDITHSERYKNIVWRQRYHVPKHLEELCLNLCSVTE